MAVTAARISVGASAVALNTADAATLTLTVRNENAIGGDTVALGPSGVTMATGFHLLAGESVSIPLKVNDVLFAIYAGTTNALVSVLRT